MWISFRVSEDEKNKINIKSQECGLSRSQYIKRTALFFTPKSKIDRQAIFDLKKLHGDIGRVGGLLKMWLSNHEDVALFDKLDVQGLVQEIRQLKQQISKAVEKL